MAYYVYSRKTGQRIAAFVHVPRTGGTWIRKALDEVGCRTEMIGYAHQPLEVVDSNVFTFAFIREPVTWYQSMFAFRQTTGWPLWDSFPWRPAFKADVLEGFVSNVSKFYPRGYLLQVYDRALNDRGRKVDFVGRFERLESDFREVIEMINDGSLDAEKAFFVNPQNVSQSLPTVKRSTELVIRRYEWRTIQEWFPQCTIGCATK